MMPKSGICKQGVICKFVLQSETKKLTSYQEKQLIKNEKLKLKLVEKILIFEKKPITETNKNKLLSLKTSELKKRLKSNN